MKKILYYIILALIICVIPVVFYFLIDTMMSIKNETDGIDTCISKLTGKNLCAQIDQLKVTIYIDLIVMIIWLALKSFIVKK